MWKIYVAWIQHLSFSIELAITLHVLYAAQYDQRGYCIPTWSPQARLARAWGASNKGEVRLTPLQMKIQRHITSKNPEVTNSVDLKIFSGFGDQSRYLPQCCRRYLGKWYLSSSWPPSNCTALWEGWCLHPCTTGSKFTYALCRWWIFPVVLSSPIKHNACIVLLLKLVMPLSVCQQSWFFSQYKVRQSGCRQWHFLVIPLIYCVVFQHYTELSDIKRVIINTHAIEPQVCCMNTENSSPLATDSKLCFHMSS